MKKILLSILAAVVLIGGGFTIYNHQESSKRPACNSEEVNEALINLFDAEFAKTGLNLGSFSLTDITQRKSKISDNTNVCSGTAHMDSNYLGIPYRGGEVSITFTAQKTLNNKVKVDIYSVGSKDLKTLND